MDCSGDGVESLRVGSPTLSVKPEERAETRGTRCHNRARMAAALHFFFLQANFGQKQNSTS